MLGVILEENTPEELQVLDRSRVFFLVDLTLEFGNCGWSIIQCFFTWQKQVTVKSSALEVLLEITKYCDLYLMETVLDDETEVSGGLDILNNDIVLCYGR